MATGQTLQTYLSEKECPSAVEGVNVSGVACTVDGSVSVIEFGTDSRGGVLSPGFNETFPDLRVFRGPQAGLIGSVPADFSFPVHLVEWNTSRNQLSGTLSRSVIADALAHVETLDVSFNQLSFGDEADLSEEEAATVLSVGPQVVNLVMRFNRFVGNLGTIFDFSQASSLARFSADGNGFTGTAPGTLGTLPDLTLCVLQTVEFDSRPGGNRLCCEQPGATEARCTLEFEEDEGAACIAESVEVCSVVPLDDRADGDIKFISPGSGAAPGSGDSSSQGTDAADGSGDEMTFGVLPATIGGVQTLVVLVLILAAVCLLVGVACACRTRRSTNASSAAAHASGDGSNGGRRRKKDKGRRKGGYEDGVELGDLHTPVLVTSTGGGSASGSYGSSSFDSTKDMYSDQQRGRKSLRSSSPVVGGGGGGSRLRSSLGASSGAEQGGARSRHRSRKGTRREVMRSDAGGVYGAAGVADVGAAGLYASAFEPIPDAGDVPYQSPGIADAIDAPPSLGGEPSIGVSTGGAYGMMPTGPQRAPPPPPPLSDSPASGTPYQSMI
jgi:hypothetical protein